MPSVVSVNVGSREPNPWKRAGWTGIGKVPQQGPVEVRSPGPEKGTSGLVGDFIGDRRSHGGDAQAVYAVAREDLDRWQQRLGRDLPDGCFGENLTTSGIDVNACLLGERWRVGPVLELVVTVPRIPCSTFRGVMDEITPRRSSPPLRSPEQRRGDPEEKGWLKTFTEDARPGSYLSVAVPGPVTAGDPIEVLHRPDHDVTVSHCFRALTTDRSLLPGLESAEPYLVPELLATVRGA